MDGRDCFSEEDIEVLGKLSIYLSALLAGIAGSAGGDNC